LQGGVLPKIMIKDPNERMQDLNAAEEFRRYYTSVPLPTQREVLKKYGIKLKTFEIWLKCLELKKHSRRYVGKRGGESFMPRPPKAAKKQEVQREKLVSIASRFRGDGLTTLNPRRFDQG
jgi:hypothetical protein